MASAQSPKDIVEQWLVGYQAAKPRSEEEMRALHEELERLDERQLRRFLDWLDDRRARRSPGDPPAPTPAAPTAAASPARVADTGLARIAGFGLPRPSGNSPWSLRPRRMKRRRHGLSH